MKENKQRPFEALIFDLDGTLIDSIWVWRDMDSNYLLQKGLQIDDDYIEKIHQLSFYDGAKFTIDYYHLNQSPEEVIEELENLAFEAYEKEVQWKPGAKDLLFALKEKKIPFALATAGRPKLVEVFLKKEGVLDLFDSICYIEEVSTGKTSPEIYQLAAQRLGYPPEACRVFEDLLTACRGAKDGGFQVQAVYDEASKEHHPEMLALTGYPLVYHWNEIKDVL